MFTEAQREAIASNFGPDAADGLARAAATCSKNWGLTDLRFHEHYSMNLIFFCASDVHGECVLKLAGGLQNAEFASERNVLRAYEGRRFVRLYESDERAMLIERVLPGTPLSEERCMERRLDALCALYEKLHIAPADKGLYHSYIGKVAHYARIMGSMEGHAELVAHMAKAEAICLSIRARYERDMLLHGDLNAGNILLNRCGEYVLIDPQGLVGDPVFELSRFLMMELHNGMELPETELRAKMEYIVLSLSKRLCIPEKILLKCLYVEAVTFEAWGATVGEYHLDRIRFAENLL